MNVAIIPARGGSKRIPKKNIRDFCGRPCIEYSIRAAQNSGVFDRILVSTDCDKIAEVAVACGAEVPFVRPPELSDDHTPTIPVIRHAINTIHEPENPVTYACCIYATAPFVCVEDIRTSLEKIQTTQDAEFVFPVTTFAFPIFRALKIDQGTLQMVWPEHELSRSQDLPEVFHDVGQFYWGTKNAWDKNAGIYSAKSVPIVIPRHRVQDLDTVEDWERAELTYKVLFSSQKSETRF